MASITRKVAMDLMRSIAIFFRQGGGMPINPDHEYDTDWDVGVALVDDIHPEDYDLAYWANNILLLLRTMYGILANAVAEDDIVDELIDDL